MKQIGVFRHQHKPSMNLWTVNWWGVVGLMSVLVLFTTGPSWSQPLEWRVYLCEAHEDQTTSIMVPQELNQARAALQKLANHSRLRRFVLKKTEEFRTTPQQSRQVSFSKELVFQFEYHDHQGNWIVETGWFEPQPDTRTLKPLAGKIRKPFQPGQSLVVLGPISGQNQMAMAVLELKK